MDFLINRIFFSFWYVTLYTLARCQQEFGAERHLLVAETASNAVMITENLVMRGSCACLHIELFSSISCWNTRRSETGQIFGEFSSLLKFIAPLNHWHMWITIVTSYSSNFGINFYWLTHLSCWKLSYCTQIVHGLIFYRRCHFVTDLRLLEKSKLQVLLIDSSQILKQTIHRITLVWP